MSEKDNEKKKVVFKLSFSKHEALSGKKEQPQMVTEWNYMRVAIALIILFVLIAVGFGLFQNDNKLVIAAKKTDEKQAKESQSNIRNILNKAAGSIVLKEKKELYDTALEDRKKISINAATQRSGKVIRAQLAKGVWKNEPFGKLVGEIIVNKEEATGIFYFTELHNMKDQTVFHIWKYKGNVIFKKKRDVLETLFKTYTSKLFTRRSVGPWSVETVDSNEQQLNVINFTVIRAVD